MKDNNATLKYAFKASLPVMTGYIVLGTGFGIMLNSHGYAWWWATLMSLIIYAGSMQYVSIDLLATGANLLTVAIMTLMVNVRHIFYGITMLSKYRETGKEKPYLIFALTDETFSLVCSPNLPENVEEKKYFLYLSAMNQFYWVFGSTLGAIAGTAFQFDSKGIDFSMTALFIVIFIEQWESAQNHIPAIAGFVITLICLLLFGSKNFLIPSMIGITILLLALKKNLEKKEDV